MFYDYCMFCLMSGFFYNGGTGVILLLWIIIAVRGEAGSGRINPFYDPFF
ncbi:hypothetical protein SAMN06265361_10169 [Laceyella tengchongensis]|uniref:Uncharacterized protein n=1 Tax=Laceyella tengchongensis TaxID=574699 RepID=A0AA45WIA1_9BACL|nr:hypothetical protein SAMN06265361_10169 [Laceyella tengchongensis]